MADEKQKPPQIAELDALNRKILEARRELEKYQEEIRQHQAGGAAVLSNTPIYVGSGYKFRVETLKPEWHQKCPPKDIIADDASEAKRFYAATTQDPQRPGRMLDTVKYELKVTMVEGQERMQANQSMLVKAAMIRKKWNSTGVASPEELKWMEENDQTLM